MNEFRSKTKVFPHVIIALITLALVAIAHWGVYWRDEAEPTGTTGNIIVIAMSSIGAIILYFALRAIIRRPDVIRINEKGFEYNPGGVSSGFIEWDNVHEIKRVQVRTQQGQLNGPIVETAIGIKLKDPSLYTDQFNIILRKLMLVNTALYDLDLLIRISSLGKDAEKVERMLMSRSVPGHLET